EEFVFVCELFDTEYLPVRARRVRAELEANARYVIDAADRHFATLHRQDRSFSRALLAHSAPTFDRFAESHPERREFRRDQPPSLSAPAEVRRALAVARRFSDGDSLEYLVLARGYPLARWQKLRRAVLERAIGFGLWMGGPMAALAVEEG